MLKSRDESRPSAGRALLAFSAAVFVFHQLPTLAGDTAGDWIDLVTPFAVVAAAAFLLGRDAPALALVVAVVGALLYVDGHGIHLAANSIGHEQLTGDAKDVTHFWDEEWGHAEWHLGWFVLVLAACLGERGRPVRLQPWQAVVSALLLGWALFVSTVEGSTWWLELGATAVFVPWAAAAQRPVLVACAAGFGFAALLIGVWALWHGGVPQFSEVGFI
ncbi:MAG TPA: hypothetical protein VF877_08495 [Gaiellaceae bacterium]